MKFQLSAILGVVASVFLPVPASALNMVEFMAICESRPEMECESYPVLQAYVGGSLDMIAMLDEETDYLADVYCVEPRELFDVSRIIQFMEKHARGHGKKNAMLLVIRYLEEHGGCR